MSTQGERGEQGEVGSTGETGSTGLTGETGQRGGIGHTGSQGATGRIGDTGRQGAPGLEGHQGEAGLIGRDGVIGERGPTGDHGQAGDQGHQGLRGERGRQGDPGIVGDTGTKGPPVFTKVQVLALFLFVVLAFTVLAFRSEINADAIRKSNKIQCERTNANSNTINEFLDLIIDAVKKSPQIDAKEKAARIKKYEAAKVVPLKNCAGQITEGIAR